MGRGRKLKHMYRVMQMGKRVLHLYVSDKLVEEAKKRGINLSQAFEQYLTTLLQAETKTKTLTEEEIDKKILELEKKISELKALKERMQRSEEYNVALDIIDKLRIIGELNADITLDDAVIILFDRNIISEEEMNKLRDKLAELGISDKLVGEYI